MLGGAMVDVQNQEPVIAHILFMDLVEFGKLRTDESFDTVRQLQALVKQTEQVRLGLASDIIRLPTGDGMALVFFRSPLAPVECAVEVSRALRNVPELRLRMGINTGPVYPVIDINESRNVSGTGINMAERVMSCGDANHILVSQRTA
jgi:class 3 adenylate cyclase